MGFYTKETKEVYFSDCQAATQGSLWRLPLLLVVSQSQGAPFPNGLAPQRRQQCRKVSLAVPC
ncbi:MAG: hypothetical protein JWM99_3985 [Verrucomicrobiales bacterium]|nr:hypothetical protein [Verrucomicrobiales bacterium]